MGYVTWNERECEDFAKVAKSVIKYDYVPWVNKVSQIINPLFKTPLILDIGAGSGELSIAIKNVIPDAKFILTDNATGMETIAKKNILDIDNMEFIKCSSEQLTIGSNSIDVAICKHLLTHVTNPEIIIIEIIRVLKTSGVLIIIDFDSSASQIKAMIFYCLVRLKFGKKRAAKFWYGYKNGYSIKKLKEIYNSNKLINVIVETSGVNCLIAGKK